MSLRLQRSAAGFSLAGFLARVAATRDLQSSRGRQFHRTSSHSHFLACVVVHPREGRCNGLHTGTNKIFPPCPKQAAGGLEISNAQSLGSCLPASTGALGEVLPMNLHVFDPRPVRP